MLLISTQLGEFALRSKASIVRLEGQAHITDRTISVLSDDELTDTSQVFPCLRITVDLVVLRAMDEAYDVGILLDST